MDVRMGRSPLAADLTETMFASPIRWMVMLPFMLIYRTEQSYGRKAFCAEDLPVDREIQEFHLLLTSILSVGVQ